MGTRKITRPGNWFAQPEITQTVFQLSGASIAISAGIATVTLASHLLTTGALVTFSGVTGAGVTGLNNATWGPITVTGSGAYTFTTTLTGTPGGTIVQNGPLYFIPAGQWNIVTGANGVVEYDPGNLYGSNLASWNFTTATGVPILTSGVDSTWRVIIPASSQGYIETDGYSHRFRPNGTTATSYFAQSA